MMKFFLWVCFGLFILLASAFFFVPAYRQEVSKLLSYSACDTPLPYRLGVVDPRFDLSKDEVLTDITTATNIWTTAEGKTLFTYSPTAQLTVNFIYDQRQALDTTINQLNSKIAANNNSLQQQIADYEAQVTSLKQRFDAFNATVEKYNQEGGAPPQVYNDLIAHQKELNAEAAALNERAKQLNLSTTNYNTDVSNLNEDITQFNTELAQKPEEGLYNGNDNTITIYFANNHDELIHTLTHEFGHALGMQHVKDPNAIMYPYTTSSLTVTLDDMQQLDYVCREQSAIIHYAQVFDLWFYTEIQQIKKQLTQ